MPDPLARFIAIIACYPELQWLDRLRLRRLILESSDAVLLDVLRDLGAMLDSSDSTVAVDDAPVTAMDEYFQATGIQRSGAERKYRHMLRSTLHDLLSLATSSEHQ